MNPHGTHSQICGEEGVYSAMRTPKAASTLILVLLRWTSTTDEILIDSVI